MAIAILKNLDVAQEAPQLPMRVDLAQTLASSEPSERVTIVYSLDPGNDVFFDDGTKSATRTETVAQAATPIAHRVKLVHGAGEPKTRITLFQTITDAIGIKTPDQTTVTIRRAP
jgi:hypothetical protein